MKTKFYLLFILIVLTISFFSFKISISVRDAKYNPRSKLRKTDIIKINDLPSVEEILRLVWEVSVKKSPAEAPIIYNDLVFINTNSKFAIEVETGKKLFFDNTVDREILKLKCKDSIFYFNNLDSMFVLNIFNNEALIKTKTGGNIGIYPLKYQKVVLPAYNLVYFDLFKKEKIWEKESGYTRIIKGNNTTHIIDFAKNVPPMLYELNLQTGNKIWQKEIDKIESNVIFYKYKLLYGVYDKGLIEFDLSTKNQRVVRKEPNSNNEIFILNLHLEKDSLFIIGNNISLININTYKSLWKQDLNCEGNYFGITANHIFIQNDMTIVALNKKTGDPEYKGWKEYDFNSKSDAGNDLGLNFSRTMYKDYICAYAENGKIYCFKVLK